MKKETKFILILFLISSQTIQLFSQMTVIDKIDTYSKCSSNFKIRNNCISYIAADENNISKLFVVLQNLEDNKKTIIFKTSMYPPIGWFDDKNVLVLQESNDGCFISNLNIKSRQTKRLLNADSIYYKEKCIAYDDSIFLFAHHDFDSLNENRVWKYNMTNNKYELIKSLTGKIIYRLSYNKSTNCIVYYFEMSNEKKQIQMFIDNKLLTVEELDEKNNSLICPFVLSEDGNFLYFISNKQGLAILKKFNVSSREMTNLYTFPSGIDCLDMSISKNKIALTLENNNPETTNNLFTISKDEITMGFDCNRRLFILTLVK
jgi:hypothetical protein